MSGTLRLIQQTKYLLVFQHPELLVASYNANEDAPHDPDGVVLIWNSKFKKTTPEYVFHCQVTELSTPIYEPLRERKWSLGVLDRVKHKPACAAKKDW